MANQFRIDDPDFDASGAQGLRPAALRNRRSPPSPPGRPGLRAPDATSSASPSGVLAADMRSPSERMQASTLLFANRGRQIASFVPSSSPCLARAGSHAMQLFGFKGDSGLCPRSLHRVPPWGVTGSDPATGGCSSSRPFAVVKFRTRGGPSEGRWRGQKTIVGSPATELAIETLLSRYALERPSWLRDARRIDLRHGRFELFEPP